MSALPDDSLSHPVGAAVDQIDAVLDEVAGLSLWSIADADLPPLTAAAGRVLNRVQELLVRLLGEMDSRELASRLGASTTAGWVRHELTLTFREARQLAAIAKATRGELVATGQALAEGGVTLAHAGAIVGAVQALPADLDPDIARRAERDLITWAAHLDAEQLARAGAHILQVVAPEIGDALEAKRLAAQEERGSAPP